MQSWKRFFTSCAMAYNKQHKRAGNLFHRPFKRIEVNTDSYFSQVVVHIHTNLQKHKLCKDFTQYKWSSWGTIISEKPTLLCRQELIAWFGGLQQLITLHKEQGMYNYDYIVNDKAD